MRDIDRPLSGHIIIEYRRKFHQIKCPSTEYEDFYLDSHCSSDHTWLDIITSNASSISLTSEYFIIDVDS